MESNSFSEAYNNSEAYNANNKEMLMKENLVWVRVLIIRKKMKDTNTLIIMYRSCYSIFRSDKHVSVYKQ